jgi:protoporphyrin/coproporphyrin ferrochelatase
VALPIAIVALNLGGPASLDAVEPFLHNLFNDPGVTRLGWAWPLRPLLAKVISHRRAPRSREAYSQIGGRSPILEETLAQVTAVAEAVSAAGVAAFPFVSMAYWHPFAREAMEAVWASGIRRAVALPLYPQYSDTTSGSSLRALSRAADPVECEVQIARVSSYPSLPGFIEAVCETIEIALARLPEDLRAAAPVLFSAHGLPESCIRRGDPYLDEIRTTVVAVGKRLALAGRARLAFHSRVGRQRWLGPSLEQTLADLAGGGARAVVVCPISLTGEHVATLHELDLLQRAHAEARGLTHFARARTVGTAPAFIAALAGLCLDVARARGWT